MPRTTIRLSSALLLVVAGLMASSVGPAPAAMPPQQPAATSFAVEVKDEAGQPVLGAVVAAGVLDGEAVRDVSFAETGADGMARFEREPKAGIWVVGFKGGLSFTSRNLFDPTGQIPTPLTLPLGQILGGTVVDKDGHPVEGAEVRVEGAQASGRNRAPLFAPVLVGVVRGTPIEEAIVTRTGADGRFRFDSVPAGALIGLGASAPGKATASARATSAATGAKGVSADSVRITLTPEARVVGQVASRVPGVPVGGRTVVLRGVLDGRSGSIRGQATTDGAGRFVIGGLATGQANVFLDGVPVGAPWTVVAATGVNLVPEMPAEARLEIVAGVDVTGTVAATDGTPLAGLSVAAYGAGNPRTGSTPLSAMTDAAGSYRFRLPPGSAFVVLSSTTPGYAPVGPNGSQLNVTIPEGVATFALKPILLAAGTRLAGKVVDAAGTPIAGAKLINVATPGQYRGQTDVPTAVTDAEGLFSVANQTNGQAIPVGAMTCVGVRLDDGREFDAEVVANWANKPVTIKLPAFAAGGPAGPDEVAADEVAGTVVDPQGKPIAGVLVHPISWVPNFQTRSDEAGRFRIKVRDTGKVEVRVTKEGYEPREFLKHPLGQAGWVVVLDNRTYFEGRVVAPDGSPVADAPIRADSGRKQMDGGIMTECFTDGKSGADGHYRLYVEPGLYDFQIRVSGKGVLRLGKQAIGTDEVVPLDLKLIPGANFEARVVHSLTGAPVAGYRLENWRNPAIHGTSDADGIVRINDMMPGPFQFTKVHTDVEYARWWSPACTTEYSRFQAADRFGFQRNLDGLDFEIQPGMAPVTITVEPATTIRGTVFDPDGKPIADATVAPALTGSGNSLTGDTRFSVATGPDGTYTMKLPASGAIEYNLVAHDGKYGETRTWGNGVLDPFRTSPGMVLQDVNLRLTRPAIVTGRVVDMLTGAPIANREVRASSTDKLENRYYVPSTRTDADGNFVLRGIRPAEQFIQASPFWLNAADAPAGTSLTVTLTPGENRDGVVLKSSARER